MADLVATCLLARIHFSKQDTIFSDHVNTYWHSMKSRNSFAAADLTLENGDFEGVPYSDFKNKVNMATGFFVILGLGIIIR